MPLLGKKSYKPSPFPKDLKPEEEVFVIKETNEVFRSYDEYVNRIILYGFQVWSCQLTGKTNLKYAEAVACEEQALKRLESFPKYFEKPILQIVHHSSSGLQTLAQQCYKLLENEYFENEPVECCVSGQWHKGKISRVHRESIASSDSNNISSTSISPSSDKENSIIEKSQSLIEKNSGLQYDLTCESIPDGLKGILEGDIKRLKKLPSVELLKCFIRANTENPWSNDNSPWLVKTELARKYSLTDKLKDFTLIFNKKTTPKSKPPTKRTKSTEKPKKKLLDEGAGHSKLKVNKMDPSQRKLDAFRKSTADISKTTDKTTTSSMKLTQNALKEHTPLVKDPVEGSSSLRETDDKTPSGQLRGTPIKCRLVLTPVKSPYKGTGKSPAQKISGIKGARNKSKTDCVVIEDDTSEVTTISSKTPKKSLCKSVNKLKKSPKGSKPKKATELAEAKRNDKLLKDAAPSKSVETVVIDGDIKKKDLSIKKAESEKKAKTPKADTVQRTELVNLADQSDDDFVSFPKKLEVHVTPISVKHSASKMKQMTLLDLTKKTDDDKAAPLSPKIKAKKQKTLSEMFSAALQKDKPRALNALIRETAKEVSSPSNLVLNLPTQQRHHVAEKWHAHQERLKWKTMSAEEKAKNRLERIKLQRQLNGKLVAKKKPEDHELLDLKPLPPAKPVNQLTGISPESFSDVAMIAEFVHTFRDLLVPKETLHISIDNLSEALVAGVKGFALVSRMLVIFLQILLQESSTKGREVGLQLSEMPLTQQTASEVSRLYLSSKLKILTAYEEDKQLQGILESLQHAELYSLTADEKIKILVTLCHEVLSSDTFDDYMGSQFAAATELRKEKMAKLKEKKDQQKEENERLKREKEGLQKQKEDEESKKQLTMDDLNKKGETESSHTNSEATASVSPASEHSSKNGEQKATKKTTKDTGTKKDSEEVSDVVKAMRKRREDMANKEERKLKEEKDRLEKEEKEQWNINMAHCQYTKRLEPIGYDRNHARYWVFNGIAVGVYVEQGWRNLEDLSQTFDESSKEVAMETGDSNQTPFDGDVEIVGETKDEKKMDAQKKDNIQELRLPDIPYSWSCYDTVEEVQWLLECLSHQGVRESALRKALNAQMESITEGIRRNSYRKPTKLDTEEEGLLNSMKEELKDVAERLVHGNLAILDDGLEEYQKAVDNSSSVGDLASHLEKLLPSVLPQFYQGMFSKDKANSEKAKECWVEEVKKAATASRLHLLLGILDSTVIWDLSAENAKCKICRMKGIGKTLMILCDDCNLGYHLQCLRPALSEVPEGHWSCPVCKPNERLSSRTSIKNYKEGSSSEDQDEEASEASLGDSEDSSLEDETDEHEDYCHTCGEDGDLIGCDSCPLVFHTVCHQPPLRNIPRGAWSCWQCRQPKDKKQKKNLQGGHTTKSKAAKNKAKKRARQVESSQRTSKRKRSRSLSSEDSGYQKSSKRTRQRRQPMEIADDDSAPGRRRKARASIEDLSDDESFVRKRKASKSKQGGGKQAASRNGSVMSRLRRRYPQDSEDEKEQSPDSNVKSFYGRSTRRTCQGKMSNDSNISDDEDDDDEEEEEEEPVTQRKKTTRAARHPERSSRRNRRPIVGDSEDEDEDNETGENESRKTSLRKKSGISNSARRSMRNQRRVSSSSEPPEDDDTGVSQSTNERVSGNKRNAKQVSSSSDESGLNTSKGSSSKSRALRDRCPEPNKSHRGNVKRQTQGRGGNRDRHEEGGESEDDNGKNNGGKQKKAVLKNSSTTKDRNTHTRDTIRAEVSQEDKKEKRRRVNVEMDACEQILRDLILHEDSWPFTQAVNLREVPDYMELVKSPMDLGTIRDKLKNLEYPDVESFVADVRLVFCNSDKYNLDTSEVGKAGKNLEKYFNKLFKQIFSNSDSKSKVQRKR